MVVKSLCEFLEGRVSHMIFFTLLPSLTSNEPNQNKKTLSKVRFIPKLLQCEAI